MSRVVAIAGSARGQVFDALFDSVPDGVEAVALNGSDGARLDISDADAVHRALDAVQPAAIINAAAWTGVDTAEAQPDAARAVNAEGAAHLARAAAEGGAHLVHLSTDFVFGPGDGRPFATDAPTEPLGAYGRSKRDGELAVHAIAEDAAVLRTAWVYSAHGQNFVKTMLKLMASRDEIGVVADQFGSPTWARSLARAVWRASERTLGGTLHWTGAGVASWHDFACTIHDEGLRRGLLERPVRIKALSTAEYPTPAARPAYSVLDLTDSCARLDLHPDHWQQELSHMLDELP